MEDYVMTAMADTFYTEKTPWEVLANLSAPQAGALFLVLWALFALILVEIMGNKKKWKS